MCFIRRVQSSSPSQCSNQILGDHRIVTSWTKALKVSFRRDSETEWPKIKCTTAINAVTSSSRFQRIRRKFQSGQALFCPQQPSMPVWPGRSGRGWHCCCIQRWRMGDILVHTSFHQAPLCDRKERFFVWINAVQPQLSYQSLHALMVDRLSR